ncbi:MAG: hypothetical protein MUP24_05950 [Gillisia sp.]|nr:hypothetical protein [Gillisia sp.]
MKKLVFYSLLLFCVISVNAQEVTKLKATTVTFEPFVTDVISYVDNHAFIVKENVAGEFSKNPIKFMKENFDVQNFISYLDQKKSTDLQKSNYEAYQVTFSSNKGSLEAKFSKNGELTETAQNFNNILVPLNVRRELYTNYKGWNMVKNTYTASGEGDQIHKELYRIKLKNGNKSQIVKIVPDRIGSDIVARD